MTVTAVFGVHWGDEGKGKIIDFLVNKYDIVARWNGGNNAGHTVVTKERGSIALHFVPSGISHEGKINVMGNGEIVNLESLLYEIADIKKAGIEVNPDKLVLSERSHIILPYYKDIEKRIEEKTKIGTTGRGIGVTFSKHRDRTGLRIIDLLNDKDEFERKVQMHSEEYELNLDPEKIYLTQMKYLTELEKYLRIENTVDFFRRNKGADILLEGAQGVLLDIDAGTYPYVTSSNSSPGGAYTGCMGIPKIDNVIGVMKAGYITRVGGGPFPTELGGKQSETYCEEKSHNLKFELDLYGVPFTENNGKIKYDHNHEKILELMKSENPFLKGIGLRLAGEEYGATTGRPRRTGWQDLVATAYSLAVSGSVVSPDKKSLFLTKLDVSDNFEYLDVCVGYDIDGVQTDVFPSDVKTLVKSKPVYERLKGWNEGIREVKKYSDLPRNGRNYVGFLERKLSVPVIMIGNGPDRTEIIRM